MQAADEIATQPEIQTSIPAPAPGNQESPGTGTENRFSALPSLISSCWLFPFSRIGALPFTEKPAEWYELVWHKWFPG